MAMAWYPDNELPSCEEERSSFRWHDEAMRQFRRAHPEPEAPRLETASEENCFTLLPLRGVTFSR
ncbi:hypothetical protein ACFLWN_04720, partial [Chloroflexota bacterium]